MGLKLINNTGKGQDTLVYNQETAERIVPDGLPVRSIIVDITSGEPVKIYMELDYLQVDLDNGTLGGVKMRIPGTTEIADVAEIRYKNGRVVRF